jgi:hypothetical protein
VRHAGADRSYLARDLVTERHGHGTRSRAVDDREVRVAESRGADADQYLPRTGRIEVKLADGRRLTDLLEDGGANIHKQKETAFALPMALTPPGRLES